ncbi:T9SS type A sorting domain-containing protein [Hymenobacter agri]
MHSTSSRFNCLALAALLAIGVSLPQARAQSWVTISGSPTFISGYTCEVDGIVSPAPNAKWAVHTTSDFGFSRTEISQTTNNGQTMQRRVLSFASQSHVTPLVGTFTDDYSVLDANTAWVLLRDNVAFQTGPPGSQQTASIQHTTSGLAGFTAMPGVLPAQFRKLHFFNATTGVALSYVVGNLAWQIYRTTDGGTSWTLVPLSAPVLLTSGSGKKEARGNSLWMSFADGSVLYTSDGGLTWKNSSTGLPNAQLVFRDDLHGLAYAGRQLARTTDGGQSWPLLPALWPTTVKSIVAQPGANPNASTSYIGAGYAQATTSYGFNGVIATSSDDGATWQTQLTNNLTYRYLAANEAGQLWAALEEYYRGSSLAGSAMLLRDTRGPLATKIASAENLSAYPNPTDGVFQLAGPIQGKATVRVYDAAGRLCQQTTVGDASRTVDLSAQPVGVYQVQMVKADGTIRNHRLSKTR